MNYSPCDDCDAVVAVNELVSLEAEAVWGLPGKHKLKLCVRCARDRAIALAESRVALRSVTIGAKVGGER